MAKPRKHYGKWRIRWVDENRHTGEQRGDRHSCRHMAAHRLVRRQWSGHHRVVAHGAAPVAKRQAEMSRSGE